ncbi:Non-canonical poly(A) RNA polymerase PAPD5 [Thalictrum thalictroides]|uniref:Non-canonical poly(A) RNA polymerase PAPD5 n=1 Tax=Thalictrum thalictroides TaxID=46969 RepID=A0A7J6VFQ0_THATH|nr:Non-canonical poly(A) RNA polymerase PAPD5 [Thalictrum thalictroides]
MGLIALSRALSQKGIAKKIQVIAKARVPIIKFIEKRSGVAFDISFDVDNGPKAAVFIKDAVSKIPPLRPLCLILKVFLQQRELNEVYSGGIGSYALLTMLIAQLQMHWKGQYFQGWNASLEQNLGVLLVNFFEFYGRKLNIWDVGVSCKAAGTFFIKNKKGFLNGDRPHLLSIEDPQIRSAFGMAFSTLTSAKTILNLGPNRSILGTIIRPDRLLLERKGGVNGEMTFESLLPGAGEPVHSRQHGEQEVVGNWQFNEDEEEPFPRGNLVLDEDRSHSSKKRKKAWKEKRLSLSNGKEITQLTGENKKKKSSKKRWRSNNNEDAEYSGGNGSGPFVSGSPYGRSRSPQLLVACTAHPDARPLNLEHWPPSLLSFYREVCYCDEHYYSWLDIVLKDTVYAVQVCTNHKFAHVIGESDPLYLADVMLFDVMLPLATNNEPDLEANTNGENEAAGNNVHPNQDDDGADECGHDHDDITSGTSPHYIITQNTFVANQAQPIVRV